MQGANIIRTHDVRETVDAVKFPKAVKNNELKVTLKLLSSELSRLLSLRRIKM